MENIIEPEVLREVVVDIDETHKVVQQFDKDGNMVRELWMGVVAPEPEADPREDFRSFLVDAHGNPLKEGQQLTELQISLEISGEGPGLARNYPTDIDFYNHDQFLGRHTTPGELDEHRGKLTPNWWPALSTQFGFLKTWRVTGKGTYLDGVRLSDVTIDDLKLGSRNYICATIEVPEDAQHVGGINLFGNWFGDYPQALYLRLGYSMQGETVFDTDNLE